MDRYEVLVNAIILRAVKDYRLALKRLIQNPGHTPSLRMKNDVEKFFGSEWFSTLTKINGKELLKKLRGEAA